ncbi:MAG: zf-HC2 domain-containing protein [Spirochaetales bacterium]|nr:zf-HC2 domain-containing protein [Spirochaetales bacterium]
MNQECDHGDFDCQKYVELMSDYLDNELSAADRELWTRHFDGCNPCQKFFASFESSLELIQYLQKHKCPENVARRLEDILKDKARSRQQSLA